MKTLFRKLLFLSFVLLSFACSDTGELSWTEEVKLPDGGGVVVLSRWVEFRGPHAIGDTATESRQRLEFRNPESGEVVSWESVKESGFTKTVALWLEQGRPLLLGTPAYRDDYFKLGCPNPPYILLEYASGTWRSKPLAQIRVHAVRANLTTDVKKMREEVEASNRHLTSAQTSNSYIYRDGVHRVPYLVEFLGMPAQTFDARNCDRPFNEMINGERK